MRYWNAFVPKLKALLQTEDIQETLDSLATDPKIGLTKEQLRPIYGGRTTGLSDEKKWERLTHLLHAYFPDRVDAFANFTNAEKRDFTDLRGRGGQKRNLPLYGDEIPGVLNRIENAWERDWHRKKTFSAPDSKPRWVHVMGDEGGGKTAILNAFIYGRRLRSSSGSDSRYVGLCETEHDHSINGDGGASFMYGRSFDFGDFNTENARFSKFLKTIYEGLVEPKKRVLGGGINDWIHGIRQTNEPCLIFVDGIESFFKKTHIREDSVFFRFLQVLLYSDFSSHKTRRPWATPILLVTTGRKPIVQTDVVLKGYCDWDLSDLNLRIENRFLSSELGLLQQDFELEDLPETYLTMSRMAVLEILSEQTLQIPLSPSNQSTIERFRSAMETVLDTLALLQMVIAEDALLRILQRSFLDTTQTGEFRNQNKEQKQKFEFLKQALDTLIEQHSIEVASEAWESRRFLSLHASKTRARLGQTKALPKTQKMAFQLATTLRYDMGESAHPRWIGLMVLSGRLSEAFMGTLETLFEGTESPSQSLAHLNEFFDGDFDEFPHWVPDNYKTPLLYLAGIHLVDAGRPRKAWSLFHRVVCHPTTSDSTAHETWTALGLPCQIVEAFPIRTQNQFGVYNLYGFQSSFEAMEKWGFVLQSLIRAKEITLLMGEEYMGETLCDLRESTWMPSPLLEAIEIQLDWLDRRWDGPHRIVLLDSLIRLSKTKPLDYEEQFATTLSQLVSYSQTQDTSASAPIDTLTNPFETLSCLGIDLTLSDRIHWGLAGLKDGANPSVLIDSKCLELLHGLREDTYLLCSNRLHTAIYNTLWITKYILSLFSDLQDSKNTFYGLAETQWSDEHMDFIVERIHERPTQVVRPTKLFNFDWIESELEVVWIASAEKHENRAKQLLETVKDYLEEGPIAAAAPALQTLLQVVEERLSETVESSKESI